MIKENHHITPIHKGGKDGPTVELNPWDHAELHARRFINGEDDWLHGRFLQYLSPELLEKVKLRFSELSSGENSNRWGKHPWTLGDQTVWSEECPGPGYEPGYTDSYRDKMSESLMGLVFWNDGTNHVRSRESPGTNWRRGRLPWKDEHKHSFGNPNRGTHWWNDGETNKRSEECPGTNWRRGRVK